jgi:wyosine [tRNA(Phe)-imidazoG37] synthetase (radical SAM superfamily)
MCKYYWQFPLNSILIVNKRTFLGRVLKMIIIPEGLTCKYNCGHSCERSSAWATEIQTDSSLLLTKEHKEPTEKREVGDFS